MIRRVALLLALLALTAGGILWWGQRHAWRHASADGPDAPAAPLTPMVPPGELPVPPSSLPVPGLPRAGAVAAAPRMPFGVGETALYQVEWLGLGAGVSAGTAEFAVTAPTAQGGVYQFELTAVTAPWVSAFFEARDWFGSVTTADLYPVEHRQELREGRRRVSRTAVFDRAARLVRVGDGPLASPADGETRPLPPGARDPLGAMYHVRTIDWAPGQAQRLVVSDLGHTIGVDVRADLMEPVAAEGRTQQARRLTILFTAPMASIPVPSATVWVSTDARRVPLAAQVESQYGTFRLSLVRYTGASIDTGGAAPRSPR